MRREKTAREIFDGPQQSTREYSIAFFDRASVGANARIPRETEHELRFGTNLVPRVDIDTQLERKEFVRTRFNIDRL
jgi:hypothetical protein